MRESITAGADRGSGERPLTAAQKIAGKILPIGLPTLLHDIIPNGLAVRTSVCLTSGVTYQFLFSGEPQLTVTGRVLQSMRISDQDGTVWYLTGVEFGNREQERDSIGSLIQRATKADAS